MIRVLVVTPFGKDANSLYRCIGPWSYLAKQSRRRTEALGEQVEFLVAQDSIGIQGISWDTVAQFDAVFLHRPCRPDDLKILQIAKNLNIPVWIDYDDWLFDVPGWNPHAGAYHNAGLQNIMAICIASADVVSVTTSALYDKFRAVNPQTVIIPNCYRSDLYPYRANKMPPRASAFAWRGTNTHDADLMSVQEGILNLPGPITFYGHAPWSLLNSLHHKSPGTFSTVGPQDPFLYMKRLYDDAPTCMIVPLVDCLFNRVKSNIAYMEALHAGALTIAPDLPEWHRPGVITYKASDSKDFLNACTQVVEMSTTQHDEQVSQAFDHMKELYDTSVTNQIRMQVLHAMLGSDFKRNTRDPFDQLTGLWALGQLKGTTASLTTMQKQGSA